MIGRRRGGGPGRVIVGAGSLLVLGGSVLPWYTTGGRALPSISGNAFEGASILVFVAAVALMVLIALPYASGDRPISLDRGASFIGLLALALVGYGLRLLQLLDRGLLGTPDRAPGLWLAGVGLLILAWGVVEMLGERPRR